MTRSSGFAFSFSPLIFRNKIFFNLLIFSASWAPYAQAARTIKMYPVDTPTDGSTGSAGPCWLGVTRRLDFVNLSNNAQTVTITAHDAVVHFGNCDGNPVTPNFGANWTASSVNGCWDSQTMQSSGNFVQTLVVAPNANGVAEVDFLCHTKREGITCGFNPDTSDQSGDLSTSTYMDVGQLTIDFSVAEDRGALLVNEVSAPFSFCANIVNRQRINTPVNGGRPF